MNMTSLESAESVFLSFFLRSMAKHQQVEDS